MDKITRLPDSRVMGANQTASFFLPLGRRYKTLDFFNDGQAITDTHVSEIRVNINGKQQQKFTPSQYRRIVATRRTIASIGSGAGGDFSSFKAGNAFQAYNPTVAASIGEGGGSGYLFGLNSNALALHFLEPWLQSAEAQLATAFGTSDIASLEVEFELTASFTGNIYAYATYDDVQEGIGVINKIYSRTVPVTSTVAQFTQLPVTVGAYRALHNFSAALDEISVTVDDSKIIDRLTRVVNNAMLSRKNMSIPYVGELYFPLLFNSDNMLSQALSMRKSNGTFIDSFIIDMKLSAATSFTQLAEVIGQPD